MSTGVGKKYRKAENGKKTRREDKWIKMWVKKIEEVRKPALNLNLVCYSNNNMF